MSRGDGMPPQAQTKRPKHESWCGIWFTNSAMKRCPCSCGLVPEPSPAVEDCPLGPVPHLTSQCNHGEEGPAGGEAGQDHSDDDAKRHDAGHPMETAPPELSCGFCRDEIRKPMSGPAWTAGFEEGLREGYQRGLETGREETLAGAEYAHSVEDAIQRAVAGMRERAAQAAETVRDGYTANIRVSEDEQELVRDPDGPWVLNSEVAKVIRSLPLSVADGLAPAKEKGSGKRVWRCPGEEFDLCDGRHLEKSTAPSSPTAAQNVARSGTACADHVLNGGFHHDCARCRNVSASPPTAAAKFPPGSLAPWPTAEEGVDCPGIPNPPGEGMDSVPGEDYGVSHCPGCSR